MRIGITCALCVGLIYALIGGKSNMQPIERLMWHDLAILAGALIGPVGLFVWLWQGSGQ